MAINWQTVNFDWNCARAFLLTLEEGSLSAAARALNLTQSTLSRQVASLEKELGVVLFERVGRQLNPTPSALSLYEHVSSMGAAANRISLIASSHSTELEGSVCISCTDLTAVYELPKVIGEIRKQHPALQIEIFASDEASDLRGREADIAIRAFRPTEPELIAKKLKALHASLYATPCYIETLNSPQKPSELSTANFIGFYRTNKMYIKELNKRGINVTEESFSVLTNNHLAHWELTKLGQGIGVMPIEIGDAEPLVERVIADTTIFEGDVWLVSHSELRTSLKVKTVFDFLSDALGR